MRLSSSPHRGIALPALERGHIQYPVTASSLVAVAACRFVVSNIKEGEVSDEDGYDVFEPEVSLEIHGRSALESFGRQRVPVVIMHARETWLRETQNLLRHVERGLEDEEQDEYLYPLYGTLLNIRVTRPGTGTDVEVYVDQDELKRRPAGRVSVRDWVEAVATVSRDLSDLFRRLHPSLFKDPLFAKDEVLLQQIESWLTTQGGG